MATMDESLLHRNVSGLVEDSLVLGGLVTVMALRRLGHLQEFTEQQLVEFAEQVPELRAAFLEEKYGSELPRKEVHRE